MAACHTACLPATWLAHLLRCLLRKGCCARTLDRARKDGCLPHRLLASHIACPLAALLVAQRLLCRDPRLSQGRSLPVMFVSYLPACNLQRLLSKN
eukprot:1148889-Pelagomonas_calceolata.AAC.2